MNDKNELKLAHVKSLLTEKGIFYTEYANGQLKIDSTNFWVTSEKWYDESSGERGKGLNSFMHHLNYIYT